MKIQTFANATIPTGEYVATVSSIEPAEGNYGPQLRWTLDVVSPEEHAGTSLLAWSSTSGSLKSKNVRWFGACMGRTIEPPEEIVTDDLIGRQVVVVVTVKETDDGGEYNRVENLKIHKKARLGPIPPPATAKEDEDVFGDE